MVDLGELRQKIQEEIDLLMAIATWDANIKDANPGYKENRGEIKAALERLGLTDPNEWPDLWLWYEAWKAHMPTYQERRVFLIQKYQPLFNALDGLERRQVGEGVDIPVTGWSRVDEKRGQLKEKYRLARTAEDFQGIGLICRSLLLALSDAIFDPGRHDDPNQAPIKRGDVKGRIERVLKIDFPGDENDRLRQFIRASWGYVQHVVHAETADDTRAGIAADGTLFLVNTLRRLIPQPVKQEPEPEPPPDFWDEYEPDADELATMYEYAENYGWPDEPPEEWELEEIGPSDDYDFR